MRLITIFTTMLFLFSPILAQRWRTPPSSPPSPPPSWPPNPFNEEEPTTTFPSDTPPAEESGSCHTFSQSLDECCADLDPAAKWCYTTTIFECYIPGTMECCDNDTTCFGDGCCRDGGARSITPDPEADEDHPVALPSSSLRPQSTGGLSPVEETANAAGVVHFGSFTALAGWVIGLAVL